VEISAVAQPWEQLQIEVSPRALEQPVEAPAEQQGLGLLGQEASHHPFSRVGLK